jgi:hypothetical protein
MSDARIAFEQPWPDIEKGPYRVRIWVDDVSGRQAVVGVEMWGVAPKSQVWDEKRVQPSEAATSIFGARFEPYALPETPITAAAIRLPLGKLLDEYVATFKTMGQAILQMEGADADAVAALLKRFEPPRGKGGRPRLTNEKLELIAARYREAEEAGVRAPARYVTNYLQRLYQDRTLNHDTVRSWIKTARDRGLLPPATPVRSKP